MHQEKGVTEYTIEEAWQFVSFGDVGKPGAHH